MSNYSSPHEIFEGKKLNYVFEKNRAPTGTEYLTVSEINNGERTGNQILIFPEDAKAFGTAYFNAFHQLFGLGEPTRKENANTYMHMQKAIHKNAYQPWTEDDDFGLEQLFRSGMLVGELAEYFERNEGAIRSRLKKLGLQ